MAHITPELHDDFSLIDFDLKVVSLVRFAINWNMCTMFEPPIPRFCTMFYIIFFYRLR